MNDVLIIFVMPDTVLWMVVLLIYLSKKDVDKKATEKVTGVVLGDRTYPVTSSDETSYGRVSLVEYTINGKQYKREFPIN